MSPRFNKYIGSLYGAFFLINPSAEFVKQDFSEHIKTSFEESFEVDETYFKTPEEVDAFFFSKQGADKGNLKKYVDNYKVLIESASSTFKIPFPFQSCLIFKESRFDSRAVSHVGALGVAQFTKDTYDFMSRALRIGKNSKDDQGNEVLEIEDYLFEVDEMDKLSYSKYNLKVFKIMSNLWEEYLLKNNIKSIDLSKQSYKRILYKPEYAIGLSSMYLYYLKNRVKFKVQDHANDKHFKDPNFFLTVAGAYNQGSGRLFKALKRSKKRPHFRKWISHQSKVSETKDYIGSIKTCMEKSAESRRIAKSLAKSSQTKQKKTNLN